jgi:hypothetical protein
VSTMRRLARPVIATAGVAGLLLTGPTAGARAATVVTGFQSADRAAHQDVAVEHSADENAVAQQGEVTDANGSPVTQPKAQLTDATATDDSTTVTVTATTASYADPATDPGYQSPFTGIDWEIDTTVPGADQYDVVLAAKQTSSTSPVEAIVYKNSFTNGGMTGASTPTCDLTTTPSTPSFTADPATSTYTVSFPASCLGSPSFFRFNTTALYDADSSDTTGADYDRSTIPSTALDKVPEGEPDVEAGGTQFPAEGYWLFTSDGQVFNHGEAQFYGSVDGGTLAAPIISAVPTADGGGYYLVGADGGVFTYGDARFFGSEGDHKLNAPIVSIIPDATGKGYWLIAKDGGVFAFGDAPFEGSEGAARLNAPIVAGAAYGSTGYYMVGADGGIFSFGGAPFDGSTGDVKLAQPIVGMALAPKGGYWLVASDGGVFTFGGAPFDGSTGKTKLAAPIVSLVPASGGPGYRLVGSDGGIFTFGGAEFDGSEGGSGLGDVFVAAASAPPVNPGGNG